MNLTVDDIDAHAWQKGINDCPIILDFLKYRKYLRVHGINYINELLQSYKDIKIIIIDNEYLPHLMTLKDVIPKSINKLIRIKDAIFQEDVTFLLDEKIDLTNINFENSIENIKKQIEEKKLIKMIPNLKELKGEIDHISNTLEKMNDDTKDFTEHFKNFLDKDLPEEYVTKKEFLENKEKIHKDISKIHRGIWDFILMFIIYLIIDHYFIKKL